MTARLDGRVAIVTGASRGIGRAVAQELANAGAKVVVNYTQAKDMAEGLVEEIKKGGGDAIAIQADVSKFEECKRLVDESLAAFGQVDVLVNNAGINRDRTIQRMSPEEWHYPATCANATSAASSTCRASSASPETSARPTTRPPRPA
jgi:acetoacetyl-CoA reductase